MGTEFLYTTKINLVLIQTRLLYIKMWFIIPRETTKKITKRYNRKLKWYSRKILTTEGMEVTEK